MIDLLLTVMRWCLLLITLSGLYYVAKHALGVISFVVPLFVLSCITLVLYIGGLFGVLFPAVIVITLLGCCGFFLLLQEKRRTLRHKGEVSPISIAFAVGSLFFLWLLLFCQLEHQDNFSHWASVVKTMLLTNAFPSNQPSIVLFTDYPLGSSCFIYYVCRIVNHSHGTMLVAQAMCIFAGFYACFGIITETKRFLLYIFLAMGCCALSYFHISIRLNNLLVDFWMPTMAVSIMATIFRYRDDFPKACLLASPSIAFLMLLKNSALLYVMVVMGFLIWTAFRTKEGQKKCLWLALACCSLAVCVKGLWHLHVSLTFPGAYHKFSLTPATIQNVWNEKSISEVQTIITLMGKALIDPTSRSIVGLWVFEGIAIAVCLYSHFKLKKHFRLMRLLPLLNVMVLLYFVGLLAMYLFAMPLSEAIYLAAFERYASSIVVFFAMSIVICLTVDLENSFSIKMGNVYDYKAFRSIEAKKQYNTAVVACIIATLLLLTSEYNGMIFNHTHYPDSTPYKVFSLIEDTWPKDHEIDEAQYLVYASDDEGHVTNFYVQQVVRYALYAPNISAICTLDDNFKETLTTYDTLIILDSTQDIQTAMMTHFELDGTVGFYDVDELLSSHP